MPLWVCVRAAAALAGAAAMLCSTVVAADDPADVARPAQDFSRAEPLEALQGGAATSRKHTIDRNAFSQASGNLDFKREFDFKIGNGIFRKTWVSAPASTEASDGLGPLFNARSCQGCHLKDGRGHPPSANWPEDNAISMLMRLSIPPQSDEHRSALKARLISTVDEPTYGGQLQDFAIHGQDSEGQIHIEYEEMPVRLSDGTEISLRKPTYTITEPGFGKMHADVMMSPRVANPMIGLGLLEAIKAQDILALADPDDRNGDGISGRPNRVWSQEHKKGHARAVRLEGRATDDFTADGRRLRRRHGHIDTAQSRWCRRLHEGADGMPCGPQRQHTAARQGRGVTGNVRSGGVLFA